MTDMTPAHALFLYSTAVSDVGYVRSNNQDSAFAGQRLVAICDGMGGHAGGDTASTIAVLSLAHIERDDDDNDVQAVARMMETSVMAAHDAIVGKATREHKLSGMGTTVTAVSLVAGYWVLAHIGDSRGYLLRDGKLIRMTQDHSYVQHLINTGRISEAEAKNHPQRNVVMRVLGDFDIDPRPDISIRPAKAADRWLLCSDGLCGVLEDSTIQEVLESVSDQEECAQRLVTMALKAGSTDNVTAIIADATLALDANAFDLPHQIPLVGGAAGSSLEPIADIIGSQVASSPALRQSGNNPARRAAALRKESNQQTAEQSAARVAQPSTEREESGRRIVPDTGEIPIVHKQDGTSSADPNDPEVANAIRSAHYKEIHERNTKRHRIRLTMVSILAAVLLACFVGGYGAYRWSQTQFYLGESSNTMVIYQGVPTNLFGFNLSHEVKRTKVRVSTLPKAWREQLAEGIVVSSIDEAERHAALITSEAKTLKNSDDAATSTASSSASPSASDSTQGGK